jgi:hypothetical protein
MQVTVGIERSLHAQLEFVISCAWAVMSGLVRTFEIHVDSHNMSNTLSIMYA